MKDHCNRQSVPPPEAGSHGSPRPERTSWGKLAPDPASHLASLGSRCAAPGLSSARILPWQRSHPVRPARVSAPAPLASPDVYRMTVDEYERMADAGVLNDDRIELIDGYLVKKDDARSPRMSGPSNRAHDHARADLAAGLVDPREEARYESRTSTSPNLISRSSGGRGRRIAHATRSRRTSRSLVEVSDTTLARDRGEKRAAYARGRIPIYWIINLIDRQVEVYSGPSARGYRTSRVYKSGQEIPVVIVGTKIRPVPVDNRIAAALRRVRVIRSLHRRLEAGRQRQVRSADQPIAVDMPCSAASVPSRKTGRAPPRSRSGRLVYMVPSRCVSSSTSSIFF